MEKTNEEDLGDGLTVTQIDIAKETTMSDRFELLKKAAWEAADGNIEKIIDYLVFGMLARDNLLLVVLENDTIDALTEAHRFTQKEILRTRKK